jgi:hypothetical protein
MARYLRTMVAALAATGAVAAEASAEWTPPYPVSTDDGIAERPQLAVDPSGTATVVWAQIGVQDVAIHARRVGPGGALGPILDVALEEEGGSPDVAVDAAGNAWVVWSGRDGGEAVARARRITSAGALEAVKTLSAPGETGFGPAVGVDANGTATVVWTRYENPDFRLQARTVSAGGVLGPIDDVSTDSRANVRPDLAVAASGAAVVVWSLPVGSETVVQWRRLGGPIQDLSATGSNAFAPQVAIDAAGVATAVWYRDDGTAQARRSAPGGALLPIVDLSATEAVEPDVAVDARGDATVVWARWDGVNQRAELRRYAADGTLDPVRELWTGGDDVRPRIAVDALGDATALWLNNEGGDPVVRTRSVTAAGTIGPSRDLVAVADLYLDPQLATDASGRTMAVWAHGDIPGAVIEAARFMPPVPPAVPAPAPSAAANAAATCPAVTVKSLRRHRPRRFKGVAATLRLDRDARVRLVSAKLVHRGRTVKLRTPTIAAGDEAKLRFKVPRRLARGARVRLVLKLRAAVTGCPLGATMTVRLRTSTGR